MNRTRRRVLAATVGTLCALLPATAASASSRSVPYRTYQIGPIADQVTCNIYSVQSNDPPDTYTLPCYYSATDPNITTRSVPDPGWWFSRRSLIA